MFLFFKKMNLLSCFFVLLLFFSLSTYKLFLNTHWKDMLWAPNSGENKQFREEKNDCLLNYRIVNDKVRLVSDPIYSHELCKARDNLVLLRRNNFSWPYFFHLENRTFKNTPQALRIYPLVYTVKYSVNMSCCHPFIYDIHDKCLYVPDICFTVINFMHGADFVSIFFLPVEHPYRTITLHNCLFFL